MTRDEAIAQYPVTCAAVQIKGRWVRDGNWLETSQHLRHKDCETAKVTVVKQEGLTILEITPVAPKEVPAGKSVSQRPAFYLLAR
jgi:hypothetical protein